jgi:hypothetical protein
MRVRIKPTTVKLKFGPRITDHALVRYIERCGDDKARRTLEFYRSNLVEHCRRGMLKGASAVVVHGGDKVILEGATAVTVLAKGQRPKNGSERHVVESHP